MNSEELKSKIKELEYYLNNQEIKKTKSIMFMLVTAFTILGGGLVIGLIFGSLAKVLMLAVATGVLANVGSFKAIGEANEEIKRCRHQITVYNDQMKATNNNVNIPQAVKDPPKDYAYKPEKEKTKTEVKIEKFTEEDFYEDTHSKRR